ncbi:hypothetical protein ACFSTI_09650 [Rhizorhabdus histidinilytica]
MSAPIMALPTRWSAEADVARYLVGDLGRRGSHVLIACPADGSPPSRSRSPVPVRRPAATSASVPATAPWSCMPTATG